MSTREKEDTAEIKAVPRHPGLKHLERLVGRWKISGGTNGELSYEWLPGRHFLMARGRIDQFGQLTEHVEIIGYDKPLGAEKPSDVLTSRLYTNNGDTLSYTHEVDDKTVTSWFGEKGSDTMMRAKWSDDGNMLTGEWVWPGGGYKLTLTRIG
jgi:hypothetical protein